MRKEKVFMMNVDEQIEILQAYKEGKTIIGYDYIPGPYNPIEEGDFSFNIKTLPDVAFNFQEKCYRIKTESKTRRMTNRELAKWCAEGNGQYIATLYKAVSNNFTYDEECSDHSVKGGILIRSWDETEWHEPLIEVEE